MSRKGAPTSGIGLISLFTLLMILCVSVFAVLSLTSARADLRVSQRNAQAVADYYHADAQAAQAAALLADAIWPAGKACPPPDAVTVALRDTLSLPAQADTDGDGLTVSFSLPLDEVRTMEVVISMAEGGQCDSLSRKLVVQDGAEPAPDTTLPVWTGEP